MAEKAEAAGAQGLDEADRRLLDMIQSGFPIARRPYAVIGEALGMAEEEAFQRVRALRARGIIRRIGANFQADKLGFVSTLCAASVPEERKMAFIEKVNAISGVTHNYERDHHYNLWFTLICESEEARDATLRRLAEETGMEILNLPATRLYKIKVDFQMS